MLIPTRILSSSLVGVRGTFPRGWGNYITVGDRIKYYSVVNLCYEDLKDAIALGIIGDTMEADVYGDGGDDFVAYVTDSRFPPKCLEPMWWYNTRNIYRKEILTKKYGSREKCLCQYDDSKDDAVDFTAYTYEPTRSRKGACSLCNTPFVEKF